MTEASKEQSDDLGGGGGGVQDQRSLTLSGAGAGAGAGDEVDEEDSSSSSSDDETSDDDDDSVSSNVDDDDDEEDEIDYDDEEQVLDDMENNSKSKNGVKMSTFGPLTMNEMEFGSNPVLPLPTDFDKEKDEVIPCLKVMNIQELIDSVVVVSIPSNKKGIVLDEGSVLCNMNRDLVGRIDEIFGPVSCPYYTVRLLGEYSIKGDNRDNNNNKPQKILHSDDVLCLIPKYALVVDPKNVSTKGTDASDMNQHEVNYENVDEVEFSDDEEERKALMNLRKNKNSRKRSYEGVENFEDDDVVNLEQSKEQTVVPNSKEDEVKTVVVEDENALGLPPGWF